MRSRLPAVCLVTCLAIVLCGCQHVPPTPLNRDSIPDQLARRALDLPSIREYAEQLQGRNPNPPAPYSLTDGVSLDEATAIALWYNAKVRSARSRMATVQSLPLASAELLDPVLQGGIGEKETDTPAGVEDDWISEIGIGITIPLSGRRGAARALGDAQAAYAAEQLREAKWNAARTLNQAWLMWSTATLREQLYDDQIEHFDRMSRITENLADAGELSVISARFFRVEHARLLAQRERSRGESQSARLAILNTMGLVPAAPLELQPMTELVHEAVEPEGVAPAHPTLTRLETEYQMAEQSLRLELRRQYPDLTLTPGLSDEGDETSITLGFGLPIALWNRNKLGIADAVGERERIRTKVENTYHELQHQLERSGVEHLAALRQWKHLDKHAVSLLEQQISQAQLLMDTGELNVTLLNELLRQSLQIRLDMLDASGRAKAAEIEVIAASEPERFVALSGMENSE